MKTEVRIANAGVVGMGLGLANQSHPFEIG